MKLLTTEILNKFREQGDTSYKSAHETLVIVKYFNPCGAGTWYAVEYDPENRIFFGYANIGDPSFAELGYFSLDDLENYRSANGMGLERDLYFSETTTLQEVIDAKGML